MLDLKSPILEGVCAKRQRGRLLVCQPLALPPEPGKSAGSTLTPKADRFTVIFC
jgi:hypothetical protein